jgi:hypothetical protein
MAAHLVQECVYSGSIALLPLRLECGGFETAVLELVAEELELVAEVLLRPLFLERHSYQRHWDGNGASTHLVMGLFPGSENRPARTPGME